jgi:dsRNA-specific ribonuclease
MCRGTTLASTIEAIIGAVWKDSGKDIGKVKLAVEALNIIR